MIEADETRNTKESSKKGKIIWPILLPTIVLIVAAIAGVMMNLSLVQEAVTAFYDTVSHAFSWLFVGVDVACVGFAIWAIFGKKAKLRLGGENAKPEFGFFAWAAMMFTTACSAGLILFGFIEPIYYASTPPFEIEPFSNTAYETASMYAHHHWGIAQWVIYLPAAIAIGFALYNLKEKNISVADACEPVIGKQSKGILGKIIDIVSTFGVVVAPVTSMGLGLPLVILLFQALFGIPPEYEFFTGIVVLVIWILLFGSSVFFGLRKGIKNLSKANVILAFSFMAVVGILAGLFYIFSAEINALGMYVQNFIRMDTYTDPYGTGDFVATWTVWYWAWLIVYMPLMGVLTARVSKGRTIREIAIGLVVACSLGCFVAIMTLGNYSISIQQSGVADIAAILADEGQAQAILAIVQTMPLPEVMMLLLAVICFIFMATTVDSSSFVAAEMTSRHASSDSLASRGIRLFWAVVACGITFVLLQVGGFSAVQTLAILTGLPLAVILIIIIISTIKRVSSFSESKSGIEEVSDASKHENKLER